MPKPIPKKTLLNPFEITEDQILEKVYITHYHGVETYDVESLYGVASRIIKQSIEISEIVKSGQQIEPSSEDAGPLTSFPRFRALKRIACQMICTARGEQYAHQTTILILEQLKAYSWDAKAMIALAAFALEYGQFWHLATIPRDQLGKSLAELNGLQSIHENMQHLVSFNGLVKKAMEVVECIREWKKLTSTSAEYNVKDVLAMSDTLQEIPSIAYWAIITFVACASDIDFMGDRGYKCELSKFDYKLNFILNTFKERLDKCNKQIGEIEDYSGRKEIILRDIQIGKESKDIVLVLTALLMPCPGSQEPKPSVYNGLTGEKVELQVFKKKNVLLFTSGLDNIDDEIHLLKSIYERLKEGPKEVEGYKKEDFNILWVPIVDDWNDKNKKILENYLENTKMGWYVVKEFKFSIGIKVIREVFNYKDYPIFPVISHEGKIVNYDARHILSVWGIDGFPFRTSDHKRLTQQWDWFWTEIINLNPRIGESIREDCYIFIYGGKDSKWLDDFRRAVENLKKHATITQEDITIESYPLGKDDPKIVPRFWIAIDSLLASKRQMKDGVEVMDPATTHLKRLIGLKQNPQGWVILSKGSNVKLMGQGEAMFRTVAEFDSWKEKLEQRVRFDVAFKEYYESKAKDVSQKCEYSEYANYPTDILAQIPCPIKCGRLMEVASVNYKCCHGRETTGHGSVPLPKTNPRNHWGE